MFELLRSPLLTEANLNFKSDGRRGTTALHRAVYQGTLVEPGAPDFFDYQDIAQMLVERGARSDVVCYENTKKNTFETAQLLAGGVGITLQVKTIMTQRYKKIRSKSLILFPVNTRRQGNPHNCT